MAVLTPNRALPATVRRRTLPNPLTLWHLLSFDAPTVAALWTWFIAASVHIKLPFQSIAAMAVAVWMLYAADRLLDTRHLLVNPLYVGELERRHRFHHRHRSAFITGILAASALLAILIPRLDPRAIHLYLILGSLLAGYFVVIHIAGSAGRLPKEIAVGLFFAAAVFIPTVARAPALRLVLFPAAALFALLCSLNCLFIYNWEHSIPSSSRPHPATRLALRHLGAIATLSLALDLLLSAGPTLPRIVPAACALSSALLLVLHRCRCHLSPLSLRAAADLVLLTPLLFFLHL